MFTLKDMEEIDPNYFDIIDRSSFSVTIRSKNTKHYWHIENADGDNYRSCKIYHKHNEKDSYHLHGHAGTLVGCIHTIKEHDSFQLNGRQNRDEQ